MAKTQQHAEGPAEGPSDPDLLASVVLHTLVTQGRDGITVSQVAVACEREPSDPADSEEIEAALEILLGDGLALQKEDLFLPTRAAVRASELSF
ncbi:MAG: hypothetical protein WAN93_12750 [Solirubrobacteraceae bacterium]